MELSGENNRNDRQAFLVFSLNFLQATKVEKSPSCGPAAKGRPGLMPIASCGGGYLKNSNVIHAFINLVMVFLQRISTLPNLNSKS